MAYIKAYTRNIVNNRTYPSALARSVHFAVSLNGKDYFPLNNNYGILFPKAEVGSQNEILERGAASPKIADLGHKYIIIADYVDALGNVIDDKTVWAWETFDFAVFFELGIVGKSELLHELSIASDTAAIDVTLVKAIINAYTPIHFVRADIPEHVTLNDISELDCVKAVCRYSDGSTDVKPIAWNTESVPSKGTYKIKGEIIQPEFPSPCIEGFADPTIFRYNDKWYFLATNDTTGNVGLYACGADTIEGLFTPDNPPVCILPYNEEKGLISTFWAPEFHEIGGDLYILFAVGGKIWSPQSHMMKLKRGGDILAPEAWHDPIRVMKNDGSPLGVGQITLDMTYFSANERHYVAWSQRTFSPVDSGSMIYIAEIAPDEPYKLISEPTLIARPLYGWENQNGTVNNEGPYALFISGKIYLAYSGGAAGGYSYSLGYLIADANADLLDAESWRKTITPVLTSYDMTDREGAGHNAFYVGDDGKTMIIYHAQRPDSDGKRNTYIHRVHFDRNDFPVLNLIPERDLPRSARSVSITVTLK